MLNIFINCIFKRERRNFRYKKISSKEKKICLFVYFLENYVLKKMKKLILKKTKEKKMNKFLKTIKIILLIIEMSNFGFKFRYVFFRKAKFFNLFYFCMQSIPVYSMNIMNNNKKSLFQNIMKNYWIFFGFFIFKFLDWRFNLQIQTEIKLDSNFTYIDPPKIDKNIKNVCPLCENLINIPAFVPTSNSVYCFNCLSDYILNKKRCPKSGINLNLEDIKKIYLN